jgi:hypothetical protein
MADFYSALMAGYRSAVDTGRPFRTRRGGNRRNLSGKRHAGERTHALIENDRTLTLAPWRPEMDRARNQFVYGRLEKGQLSFSYGQQAWERHHEQAQKLARDLSRGLGIGR